MYPVFNARDRVMPKETYFTIYEIDGDRVKYSITDARGIVYTTPIWADLKEAFTKEDKIESSSGRELKIKYQLVSSMQE